MAESTTYDSDKVAPTPAAISAALESNLALQSELRSRLTDVRKLRSQNRHDAEAVLSSLSLIWNKDSDTSINNSSEKKCAEKKPIEVLTTFDSSEGDKEEHNNKQNKRARVDCNNCVWTDEQVKHLQNAINEARKDALDRAPDNEILDEAASKCKIPSRSASDCKAALFTFADPIILTTKLTKKETQFILDVTNEFDGKDIDWLEIATQLNEKLYPDGHHRRTPWQCFKYYQSSLEKRAIPWSSDEDELFIKYLAAQGPQYLLQGDSLARINGNLFPHRNPNKISIRTHTTLLNPNYANDWWSKDEEQKLALLMRAYSESGDGTLPLKQASQSAHFPRRAQTLVSFKWNRSLCPKMQQKKSKGRTRNNDMDRRRAL